jgi:hypothetical protein
MANTDKRLVVFAYLGDEWAPTLSIEATRAPVGAKT